MRREVRARQAKLNVRWPDIRPLRRDATACRNMNSSSDRVSAKVAGTSAAPDAAVEVRYGAGRHPRTRGRMNALMLWAEAIGERIGLQIAIRLRSQMTSAPPVRTRAAPVVPARTAPPAQRARTTVETPRRAPGRPRREPEVPLDQFAPGSVVEFRVGRREATGSVLTVDGERAELTILDLGTNEVIRRRAWDLRLVKAAPVLVRKRRPAQETPAGAATALPPLQEAKAVAVAEAVSAAAMESLAGSPPPVPVPVPRLTSEEVKGGSTSGT
jgi:hypothetical protein